MKGKSISILGIFAAFIGVIFIVLYKAVSISALTITLGIVFMAVGLINLIFFSSINPENSGARVMSMISNAASIVFGLSLLVYTPTFAPMISFMLCLLVATCAVWQFFTLAIGVRPYQLPSWLYLFPIFLAGGAIYIYIISGKDNESMIMLITGISLALLGAACLIEGSLLGIARRHEKKMAESQETILDTDTSASLPMPKKHKPETTEDLDDEVSNH